MPGLPNRKFTMIEKMYQTGLQFTFNSDTPSDGVQYFQVLNQKWLPEPHNLAYSKISMWEDFKQFKLIKIKVFISDFKFKTVYNSPKSTQVEDEKVATYQYKWFSDDENQLQKAGTLAYNSNKLNRTKRIVSESMRPSFSYTYKVIYDSDGGWVNLENKQGYGAYSTMYNSWNHGDPTPPNRDYQSCGLSNYLVQCGALNFYKEAINKDDSMNPKARREFKLPTLMMCKRREYGKVFFGQSTNIKSVTNDMTFNLKIRSFWEFKGQRIDDVLVAP